MIITPQQIEQTALDIVNYWEESKAQEEDKIKVLEMTRDFYQDRNEHIVDQYLSQLTTRVIERNIPRTGFEDGKSN